MSTRTVELRITPAGHGCSLLLDGEEVKNCRSVSVSSGVGQATTVTFELINVEVLVTGEVETENVGLRVADVTPMQASNRWYKVVQ